MSSINFELKNMREKAEAGKKLGKEKVYITYIIGHQTKKPPPPK